MHRAHFIAVVYSRLALKQSGANSQAPFRLNSSVKNSWQYLYDQSFIEMNNKKKQYFRNSDISDQNFMQKNEEQNI